MKTLKTFEFYSNLLKQDTTTTAINSDGGSSGGGSVNTADAY